MTELLGINARGEIRMGVPPVAQMRLRKQSPETYLLEVGTDLWAPVDVEWVARLQHMLTAALIDGDDAEHVTTPESLALTGGAA